MIWFPLSLWARSLERLWEATSDQSSVAALYKDLYFDRKHCRRTVNTWPRDTVDMEDTADKADREDKRIANLVVDMAAAEDRVVVVDRGSCQYSCLTK